MHFEITKSCADSLRSFSQNNFGIQLKSSHAHELVAAYFGYSSRAALLADTACPISNLRQAEFIVLTPTAKIKERRKELNGLPQDLPDDLTEGVYLPLLNEKLILHTIWPTLENLGIALADQHLKLKAAFFRDQIVQRTGVELEFEGDEVAITVLREYISPSLLLSFQQGKRAVIAVFTLKRVAGYIGYVKTNSYYAEAETIEAAAVKMRDFYSRIITSPQSPDSVAPPSEHEPNFADWLAKHKKRDSPLGDLAQDVMRDKQWPSYDSLEHYQDYLNSRGAAIGAMDALNGAWKSYQAFLKRKAIPSSIKRPAKPAPKKEDLRKMVFVKNVTPLHYTKRTIERFNAGDKAWISLDGRKAIPVTVLEADNMYYTFRIERPSKKTDGIDYLRLDEVRSTPELACINRVTS